jgi:hypothetical protein
VIRQVFDAPPNACTTAREQAIALTERPDAARGEFRRALRDAGLDDAQILDLIHSVSVA